MGKKILVLCMMIALLILLPVFSYADLPVGFTELEYIESSGTQYINTGVAPSNNTSVSVDAQFVSLPSSDSYVLGTHDVTDGEYYRQFSIYSTNGYLSDYLTGAFGDYYIQSSSPNLNRFTASLNNTGFTLDGVSDSFTRTASLSNYPKTVFLFASSRIGNSNVYYYSSIKLYSCEFFDNGTLIRDFIPCINSSNVVGLWDDVNDVFYDNDGTGSFIPGPSLTPPDPEYTVSVSSGGNGSVSSSVSTATAGTTVTLTATPDAGYVFSEWQVLSGDVSIVNNQFIMPSSDVSVKAVFVPDGIHSITVQNDGHGTGSANPVRAEAGERITLTAVPVMGYEFDRWQVVSGSVNISNNQFIMPDSDVVIKATFKPIVYTITLNQGSNGSATVSSNTGIVGDVITLTATPDNLYSLSHWIVSPSTVNISDNTFTMPASNVTLTPVFVEQSAVSSGYEYHSGAINGQYGSEFVTMDFSFGEQPAGDYLINIYHWGGDYKPNFQLQYHDKYIAFTDSSGLSSTVIQHTGGVLSLEGSAYFIRSSTLSGDGTIWTTGEYGGGQLYLYKPTSWTINIEDIVAIPRDLAHTEDYGIYAALVSFFKGQWNEISSFLDAQISRIAGDEEAEADVSKAEEELNKEVEDLNNLGGQLEEQQTSLETQFESDFKVSDDITAQTSTFQGIYSGIFSSFGIFSIFIWLPVVLAVIKKLLRL